MSKYSNLKTTKLPSGKYKGYLYYYNEEHKRKQIAYTAKAKKYREAMVELREWEEEIRQAEKEDGKLGNTRTTARLGHTLGEVIQDYLDNQLARGILEKSTYDRQCHSAEERIYPYIGKYDFDEVNRDIINDWLTILANDGLSQNTIYTIFSIPNKVYNYYFKIGEISHNPFTFVQPPKKGKPKSTYLKPEQLDELMDALNNEYAEGDWVWTAVNIALLSGLRRGEICGLRWHDIDFKAGTISVSTAVGQTNQGGYTKNPKNESSIRTFPMIPQLIEVLKCRYDYVEEEFGVVKQTWFVISDKLSSPVEPRMLGRRFKALATKYDLVDAYGKELTLHSLRHNVATLGVKSNMDIASLSAMLGHASKALTLDVYADASPEAMRLAQKRLSESFEEESDYLTNE